MTEFTAPNIVLPDSRYCNQCPCFNDKYHEPDHTYCQMDDKISLEMDNTIEYRGVYLRPADCPLKPVATPECTTCKYIHNTSAQKPCDTCICLYDEYSNNYKPREKEQWE